MLAIDLGNTNLTWGRFDGERLVDHGALAVGDAWELPLPAWRGVTEVAVASVQREAEGALAKRWTWPEAPELVLLERDRPVPVRAEVPDRSQVGTDRLVNCLAWHRRSSRPAVIVDFGTAITLDIVSRAGSYRGGLILPGPALLARSLHTGTSLLPEVVVSPIDDVFGRDTRTCIQRGLHGLMVGGVGFHLDALRSSLPSDTVFVATGGAAASFAPRIDGIEMILPFLTLDGVRLAAESGS